MGQLALLGLGRQRSIRKEASAESEQGVKWLIGTKAFYWLIKPLKIFLYYMVPPGSWPSAQKQKKTKTTAKG